MGCRLLLANQTSSHIAFYLVLGTQVLVSWNKNMMDNVCWGKEDM